MKNDGERMLDELTDRLVETIATRVQLLRELEGGRFRQPGIIDAAEVLLALVEPMLAVPRVRESRLLKCVAQNVVKELQPESIVHRMRLVGDSPMERARHRQQLLEKWNGLRGRVQNLVVERMTADVPARAR